MNRKTKTEQTDRFEIEDDSGRRYTVDEFTTFSSVESNDGWSEWFPTGGKLRCGSTPVNPGDDDTFWFATDPERRPLRRVG
jgi:hypothetical protein